MSESEVSNRDAGLRVLDEVGIDGAVQDETAPGVVARAHLVWLVGDTAKGEEGAVHSSSADDVRVPIPSHRFKNGAPTVRIDIVRNLWLACEYDIQRVEATADEDGAVCPICLDPISVKDSLVTSCQHVFHSQCCRQSESVSVKQYGHWGCPSCREPVSYVRTIFAEPGHAPNILDAKPSSSSAKQLLSVIQTNDLIAGTVAGLLGVDDFIVGTVAEPGRESICGEPGAALRPYEEEVLNLPSLAPPELEEPSTPDNTELPTESEHHLTGQRTLTGMSALSFTSLTSEGDTFVDAVVDVIELPTSARAASLGSGGGVASAGAAAQQTSVVQVKRKIPAVLSGVLDVSAFGNTAASLAVLGQLGLSWALEDVDAALRDRRERRVREAEKHNRRLRWAAVVFLVVMLAAVGLVVYFMRKKLVS